MGRKAERQRAAKLAEELDKVGQSKEQTADEWSHHFSIQRDSCSLTEWASLKGGQFIARWTLSAFLAEYRKRVELELLQSLAKEAESSCRASMIDYYETVGECLHTRIGALEFALESGEEEEA